jgi:GTP cyclohydrolase I
MDEYDEMFVENRIKGILEFIGEDPEREGLKDTPRRVAKMYKEIFMGYDENKKPKITVFSNGHDGITYDQMIIDTGKGWSHCEHHMIPFGFTYWFAYIPSQDGKILGLSKVARIVDYYASKLQVQERLVQEIVDELWNALEGTALGMGLVMKGTHLCKVMRGVRKEGEMVTIELKGALKENPETRAEFLKFVNGN